MTEAEREAEREAELERWRDEFARLTLDAELTDLQARALLGLALGHTPLQIADAVWGSLPRPVPGRKARRAYWLRQHRRIAQVKAAQERALELVDGLYGEEVTDERYRFRRDLVECVRNRAQTDDRPPGVRGVEPARVEERLPAAKPLVASDLRLPSRRDGALAFVRRLGTI